MVLKKKKIRFWREHKALVVHPPMSYAQMVGVHLKPQSQAIYNTYLLRSVATLLCHNCELKPEATEQDLYEAAHGTGCKN